MGDISINTKTGLFTCGHCKRYVGLVHAGIGPSLCCECVRVHRQWLALGGNKYALEDEEHKGGRWCVEGLQPIIDFAENYVGGALGLLRELYERGREVRSCNCGEHDCTGFQMAYKREEWETYQPSYPIWWEITDGVPRLIEGEDRR